MTLRLYDVLESTVKDVDRWRAAPDMSKDDVLDSFSARVKLLMCHVLMTPVLGSAFAHPGDLDLSDMFAPPADAGPPQQ